MGFLLTQLSDLTILLQIHPLVQQIWTNLDGILSLFCHCPSWEVSRCGFTPLWEKSLNKPNIKLCGPRTSGFCKGTLKYYYYLLFYRKWSALSPFFFPLSPFLPFFLQYLAVEHRLPSNVQQSSCLSFLSPGLQMCSIMLSNDQQNRKTVNKP